MSLSNSQIIPFHQWIRKNKIFKRRKRFFSRVHSFNSVFILEFNELQNIDKLRRLIEYVGWVYNSDVCAEALVESEKNKIKSWRKEFNTSHSSRHKEGFNFIETNKPDYLYELCKIEGEKAGFL